MSVLRMHELEIQDAIWNPFSGATDLKEYIALSYTNEQSIKAVGAETLYENEFTISNELQIEKRIRYNFWMALADIGGFHDGLFLVLSLFMSPFAAKLFDNDLMRGNVFNWSLNRKKKRDRNRLVQSLNSPTQQLPILDVHSNMQTLLGHVSHLEVIKLSAWDSFFGCLLRGLRKKRK